MAKKNAARITLYVLAAGERSMMKNSKGKTIRPGSYVSSSYAKRFPHKVTEVRSYRSKATGWNIRKENIEKDLPTQRLHEHVRHYNKERGIESPKVEKHVTELIERIKEAPPGIPSEMLKADKSYERLFKWMVEHEDELELDLGDDLRGELEQLTDEDDEEDYE